jgi:hypothetical protein
LRASVRRQPRWTWTGLFVTLLVIAAPIAFFIWLVYPESPPPLLKVSAFDALGQRGEKITLRARLEPEEAGAAVELGGHEIVFETGTLGQTKVLGKAATRKDGVAELVIATPDERTSVIARFVGDEKRRAAQSDAKVYCWPIETPLFIVEAASLAEANAAAWSNEKIHDIEARAGAAAALQKAEAQTYKIVYLVPEVDGGPAVLKVSAWIKDSFARRSFPHGPILGGPPEAFAAVLRNVRRFAGDHRAVAARPDLATQLQGMCPLIFLGAKAPMPDMVAAPSWMDVPAKLGDRKKN